MSAISYLIDLLLSMIYPAIVPYYLPMSKDFESTMGVPFKPLGR